MRKNVPSLAGYCSATDLANASTTAKQNIEARMVPTLPGESELPWVDAEVGM